MPIVWVGRLKGHRNMQRCSGVDMFEVVMKATASHNNIKHFFCGGKEGVADQLQKASAKDLGNPNVVGTYSPPFIQYIAVDVTQIGTYNIETFGNRTNQGNTLRLVGSGTFNTTGVQTIPLYFYGAALNNNGNPLNHYFYLPSESFNQYTIIRFSQ
jgi:hypothetical protein